MSAGDSTMARWIPYRIDPALPPRVSWCYLGAGRFSEPFFEQTIERCMATPFNQLFAHDTPIDALLDWSRRGPGVSPTAFVFHTSRCGSTLFSQLAAALPGTIVISEAPPVDHVLRAPAGEEVRIEWLRALLAALGQPRAGDERHLVVKFDAWHITDVPLIQRAFPGVPCLFLYREPAEVLASQLRMPGVYMVPGMLSPALIGLDLDGVLRLGREEYFARVLALVYEAGLEQARAGRVALMNYTELPEGAVRRLLAWGGIEDSPQIRSVVERVASSDAKTPSLPFDRGAGREAAPPIAIDAANRLLRATYDRLETIRREK